MPRIDHEPHGHPLTPVARAACREARKTVWSQLGGYMQATSVEEVFAAGNYSETSMQLLEQAWNDIAGEVYLKS